MRCRRPLILSFIVAVAAFSLLAAGCGGGGSPGVVSVASSTTAATTPTQNGIVAFSRCMRSNGVPNFPDPRRVGGRSLKLTVSRLAASNSHFPAAQRACEHLLPPGGRQPQETAQQTRTRLADGLSFARCIRSHGVARFPDPTAEGRFTVEMVRAQGIDVHSPAVLRVVQACLPAAHGAITPADVRAAINHARG